MPKTMAVLQTIGRFIVADNQGRQDRFSRGKSDDRQGVWRQPSSAVWPTPNWTTVPTYTFCGPKERLLNKAELDFLAGKTAAGYLPR